MSTIFLNDNAAQKKVVLSISYDDNQERLHHSMDSIQVKKYLNDQLARWMSEGYSVVHLDTLILKKDSCFAKIYKGQKYKIGNIKWDEEQRSILEERGLKYTKLTSAPLDSVILFSYIKALIQHQNDRGYPFATARYKDVSLGDQKLNASVEIIKGNRITFDTIISEGRLVMPPKFVERLLNIHSGMPYEHSKILRASSRINDLQYVQQRELPFVRFINNQANVILTLDEKPASRFDFLIGVLPQVKDGVRKWTITGDFTAELNNTFRQGEY
ncbi:MAG: hypothetical protein WBO36_01100, partial [Saprospiraceae bacterium]